MGKKVRIEFLSQGFREVLLSPEVANELRARAERIADAAGEGFEAEVFTGSFGGGRHVATVRSDTFTAARAEAEDKALTRAIEAGR